MPTTSTTRYLLLQPFLAEIRVFLQVSLIAVNVLGIEPEDRKVESDRTSEKLNAIMNDPEYSSPFDDLAFEMYVDTDVANIIREMEVKKHVAVIGGTSWKKTVCLWN